MSSVQKAKLARDKAVLKRIWDINDPNEAFPTGMTWEPYYMDYDAVHQLRKLAEICNSMALVEHSLKFARTVRLKANSKPRLKRRTDHPLRVHHIIAHDIRFVRKALTNPLSVPMPVTEENAEMTEDEDEDGEDVGNGEAEEVDQVEPPEEVEVKSRQRRKMDAHWEEFEASMNGVPGFPLSKEQRALTESIMTLRWSHYEDHQQFAKAAKECPGWPASMTPESIDREVDKFSKERCREDMNASQKCEAMVRDCGLLPRLVVREFNDFLKEQEKARKRKPRK